MAEVVGIGWSNETNIVRIISIGHNSVPTALCPSVLAVCVFIQWLLVRKGTL